MDTEHQAEARTELQKRDILRLSNAESKQLTKACIQTALITLMGTTPFEKITITSIINRSGVSRAGFYRNYSSKEDILKDIGARVKKQIEASLTNHRYQGNMYQWYLDLFRNLSTHKQEVSLFIQAKLPPDFVLNAHERFLKKFEHHSPRERYGIIAFNSGLTQIVINWFSTGLTETPEEMADICMKLFPSVQ